MSASDSHSSLLARPGRHAVAPRKATQAQSSGMRRAKNLSFSPAVPNAAQVNALTRSAAASMVERAERMTGSRMAAYEVVAQETGATPAWLRKFLFGQEAKEPGLVVGWNILTAYRRICERVERAAENERAAARALQRQIDAATSSTLGLASGVDEEEAAGTAVEGQGQCAGLKKEKS